MYIHERRWIWSVTLIKVELKIIMILFDSSYHNNTWNHACENQKKLILDTYIRLVWTYAISINIKNELTSRSIKAHPRTNCSPCRFWNLEWATGSLPMSIVLVMACVKHRLGDYIIQKNSIENFISTMLFSIYNFNKKLEQRITPIVNDTKYQPFVVIYLLLKSTKLLIKLKLDPTIWCNPFNP